MATYIGIENNGPRLFISNDQTTETNKSFIMTNNDIITRTKVSGKGIARDTLSFTSVQNINSYNSFLMEGSKYIKRTKITGPGTIKDLGITLPTNTQHIHQNGFIINKSSESYFGVKGKFRLRRIPNIWVYKGENKR